MVVKKSDIISTALFLSLLTTSAAFADNNNLVQLDLKKFSGDSVDVTLVTSENYGDNVLVKKKSDNKYVILIPKVQSSGYNASNLSGVRDLISDVDVKTVNDTSGGYTKVTLITTKPLDVKTKTIKSSPLTAEQKEYNTLIAQANAVKNTVSTAKDASKTKIQKTEVTVDKTPAIKTKPDVKVQPKKSDIKLEEITPEVIEKQNKKVSSSKGNLLDNLPETTPSEPEPIINNEIQDIKDLAKPQDKVVDTSLAFGHKIKTKLSTVLRKISQKIPSKLQKTVGMLLLALFAIGLISKRSKRKYINNEYNENYTESQNSTETKDYDSILNNNELSWREKYQLYLDKSATPVARANNKGHYSFIKKPSKIAIENKRKELEKLVATPNEDLYEIVEDNNFYSEDNTISKAIKLKSFENQTNPLSMSKRKHRSRFRKYENELPLHEQKTINLEDSPLGSNPRSLKDGNLKVTDVDKKRIKYEPKDYIMSSLDEYLSIIDNESKVTAKSSEEKVISNPISKTKENPYFKGSIVKSSYKIDSDKGIFLVNKGGRNSLVGKVDDKVFVLKDFDTNITNPIQVRHDNANVYMVKAGDFKSLVEVNDDKMGVLIEL